MCHSIHSRKVADTSQRGRIPPPGTRSRERSVSSPTAAAAAHGNMMAIPLSKGFSGWERGDRGGGGSPLARVEWNNEKAAARTGRIDAQLGMTDTRTDADGHSRLTQSPNAAPPLHSTLRWRESVPKNLQLWLCDLVRKPNCSVAMGT